MWVLVPKGIMSIIFVVHIQELLCVLSQSRSLTRLLLKHERESSRAVVAVDVDKLIEMRTRWH